ncbi:Conserved_hypothetical protein [Hexamita inflata]|uniref:Leucine-rich repeat protein n=1 Tax=Hexamita inflata TaxID=28002 RepID=A0ABP1H7A7_9EUKA
MQSNKPNYTIIDSEVHVYDDQNLKTFEFMDSDKTKHSIQIKRCFNVSFQIVPTCVTKLKINGCRLQKLNGLSKMWLYELDLSGNNITDISELQSFWNGLTDLNLSDNQIVDISPLGVNFKTQQLKFKLKQLDLSQNRIINIDALKEQNEIEELFLYNNYIQDFTPFKRSTKLLLYNQTQRKLINGIWYPKRNHAWEYPDAKYYDFQCKLDKQQLKYYNKYLIIIKCQKQTKRMNKKYKKAVKGYAIYINHLDKKLKSIQRNFSQFMNSSAVLFSQFQNSDTIYDQ